MCDDKQPATSPVERVYNVITILIALVSAFVGVATESVAWGLVALCGPLAVLFFLEGYRLHNAEEERKHMPVRFVAQVDPDVPVSPGGGGEFASLTYYFLVVDNQGPPGEFEAQYRNVRGFGTRHEHATFHNLAWEQTEHAVLPIGRNRHQRLFVATSGELVGGDPYEEPKPTGEHWLWFNLPRVAAWTTMPFGLCRAPAQKVSGLIEFDLVVYDQKNQRERQMIASIEVGAEEPFRVVAVANESDQRPRQVRP